MGLINSFNMLDNMDGLSAGVAAIAAAMFAAMMLLTPRPDNHQPQLFIAGLLLVLVGRWWAFFGTTGPRRGCSWATQGATWSATCWPWPR